MNQRRCNVAKQKKRYYEVRGQAIIHYKRYVEYPPSVDAEEVRRRMEALQTPDTFEKVHEEVYISDIEEMEEE